MNYDVNVGMSSEKLRESQDLFVLQWWKVLNMRYTQRRMIDGRENLNVNKKKK